VIDQSELSRIMGVDVYGADGDKIGSAGQVYLDNQTGDPEWIAVRTGLFGTKESFVPLSQATIGSDRIDVPFDKETVRGAPQIDADGDLSPAEEHELYFYYGIGSGGGQPTGNNIATAETTGDYHARRDTERDTVGRDVSGPTTDDAMTRSEERLNVGTRSEKAGRARLRKYVVTEQQEVTVPVSREEVRLEREPITDANIDQAMDGPDITEEEHEVTLTAERPVVETETVPVERVRLGKETVTEQQTVGGEVRKEQVEFDDTEVKGRRR
jgi:uncharacterized protein (TIGR02271 family)